MGFWIQLGLWLLTTAISLLLAPTQKQQFDEINTDDITVPNSQGGQILPPIAGTPYIENAAVAWWGDLVVEEVKKRGGKK